jgi:hypothetical protein
VVSPAKLTLARLFESQNKPEEALKLYEDLARSQNPYDPWAAEASERREQLLQKFPNLRPAPAAAISSTPNNITISPAKTPSSSTTNTPKK